MGGLQWLLDIEGSSMPGLLCAFSVSGKALTAETPAPRKLSLDHTTISD